MIGSADPRYEPSAHETDLATRSAAHELAARYAELCDQADWDGVVALFTDDAVFDASAVYDRVMRGPHELRDFFSNAPVAVAHHPTSIHVTSIHGPTATARMKMLVLFPSGIFSVDYGWTLRDTDAGWRIERQQIAVQGRLGLPKP